MVSRWHRCLGYSWYVPSNSILQCLECYSPIVYSVCKRKCVLRTFNPKTFLKFAHPVNVFG